MVTRSRKSVRSV
ncbi:putative replication domain protein, partial [Escherichia coli EC1865]